jgi:hypothetical protein
MAGRSRQDAAIRKYVVLLNVFLFQQWYVFLNQKVFSCCCVGGGI